MFNRLFETLAQSLECTLFQMLLKVFVKAIFKNEIPQERIYCNKSVRYEFEKYILERQFLSLTGKKKINDSFSFFYLLQSITTFVCYIYCRNKLYGKKKLY